jgi:hypothetical protein
MSATSQSETDARAAARQRVALGAVIAGVSIAALFFFFRGRDGFSLSALKELAGGERVDMRVMDAGGSGPAATAKPGGQGNFIYDVPGGASGAPANVDDRQASLPAASPAELLAVAQAAKDAGFVIQGVTQCIWTRRQRELFGDAKSPARKVIESIYIECRSREDCANVRGYPTWTRGDTQFPGYRDLDAIRVMVKDAGAQPRMPMLQGAPEPVDDVMPEEQAALVAPPAPTQPAAAPSPSAAPSSVSTAAARSELAAMIRSISSEVVDELLKSRAPGAPIVEHVRGVSNFPPLNVPDMPGTKPWDVKPSLFVDQAMQGNVPRRSEELDEATVALAQQMAFTFQQIAYDERRDPNSADFSRAQLPGSARVSASENPLDDKRIVSQ